MELYLLNVIYFIQLKYNKNKNIKIKYNKNIIIPFGPMIRCN